MSYRSKFLLIFVFSLVATFFISNFAFAGTRTAGPWSWSQFVSWDDEIFSISWSWDYEGEYTDNYDYRTVNNHYSGGCISDTPFPLTVINFLNYYRNDQEVKTVYFNTQLSAMCAYPNHPYLFAKYSDPVGYDIVTDIFKTRVNSYWHSDVTTPSDIYKNKLFTW